jgi:hypothetical protein
MKLNGWLRLWLVLSGVWLLTISALGYSNISSLLEAKQWETTKEGVGTVTFVFSASQSEDFVQRYIREELLPLVDKNPSAYVGKVDSSHYDSLLKKELRPRIRSYLAVALLPPIAILIVAYLVVWIRRGFAQSAS